MARRYLPDPLPRNCERCGTEFTPVRKKWKRTICSLACQRAAFREAGTAAQARFDVRLAKGNSQRGRGAGRTYTKRLGKHEHIIVMETVLGRPLTAEEVVHHRNRNKKNNDPENLQIFPNQSEHARHHARTRKEARLFSMAGIGL